MLTALDIPPGIFGNGTELEAGRQNRWRRGNLVRWSEGLLRPVGGWTLANADDAYSGTARSLFAWRTLAAARWLAVGTHTHLYAWSEIWGLRDITPVGYVAGRVNAIEGFGYGADEYGDAEYGTPRVGQGPVLDASIFSFAAWGENLVALAIQDTRPLEWTPFDDPAEATLALPIANAPTGRALFVTAERCLVVLGAGGDPKAVQWSAFEDNTEWTPSALNAAGDFRLQTDGKLLCGLRYRGSNLLFTSTDLHRMDFIGAPLIYSFETVGKSCGPASAQAVVTTESVVVWMGERQFYSYDGVVRPLACEVEDLVFGELDPTQKSKVVAGVNPNFNEAWWFYPVTPNGVPNGMKYVVWNYKENTWHVGTLQRSAIHEPGVYDNPIMALGGNLFLHENGWNAAGTPIGAERWVESGAVSLPPSMGDGDGDTVLSVRQMVPDERTSGQTRVRFKTRLYPNGPETEYGPYALSQLTDMRFQARQVSLRVEGVADQDWRIGLPRFDIHPGGRR